MCRRVINWAYRTKHSSRDCACHEQLIRLISLLHVAGDRVAGNRRRNPGRAQRSRSLPAHRRQGTISLISREASCPRKKRRKTLMVLALAAAAVCPRSGAGARRGIQRECGIQHRAALRPGGEPSRTSGHRTKAARDRLLQSGHWRLGVADGCKQRRWASRPRKSDHRHRLRRWWHPYTYSNPLRRDEHQWRQHLPGIAGRPTGLQERCGARIGDV
jgi:hypothetical protein